MQDMSAILEAYWLLAAKRFVDNVCMTLDKKIMGAMAHKMQGTNTPERMARCDTQRQCERCFELIHDCGGELFMPDIWAAKV